MRPKTHRFGAFEFWRVREIIEQGDKEKERFKRRLARTVDKFIADQQRIS
jgi:hypothetical protein